MRISGAILAGILASGMIVVAAQADPAQTGLSAQTAPPAADAALRLQLARQIFDLSGGDAAAEAQIRGMYASIDKIVTASMPADEQKVSTALQQDMLDEMVKMVPGMIDAGTHAYADNLTVKELRDYIAWMSSDSGKALVRKAPAIRQEIIVFETPMITQMLPAMMSKVSNRVCEEQHCTPAERQMVAEVMAKVLPGHPS